MSLFQCDKCGCIENSSLTGAYWSKPLLEDHPEAIKSYMVTLGIADFKLWGSYCSACNPIWYDDKGSYGVGPRPADYMQNPAKYKDDAGVWHGQFERTYLPKMLFHTNEDGNLAHIETLDTDVDKYRLEAEEVVELAPIPRFDMRLPRPSDEKAVKRYLTMQEAAKKAPAHLQPSNEKMRRAILWSMAYQALTFEQKRREQHDQQMAKRVRPVFRAQPVEAPRPPTPEEIEREKQRSAQKIAAAQAKRDMRAKKRRTMASSPGPSA